MSEQLITEARELASRATDGPWNGTKFGYLVRGHDPMKNVLGNIKDECNLEFIARSRTLLPEMADAMEKAEAELSALREAGRWIPVSKKLPEDDPEIPMHREISFEFCTVLAVGFYAGSDKPSVSQTNRLINRRTGIEYIDSAAKTLDEWYWGGTFERITHWMPLPAAQEQKGE